MQFEFKMHLDKKLSRMIRCLLIFLLGLTFFCFRNNAFAIHPAETADTCFYLINVPPDIDVPETPHFDTTIVRVINCKIQVLKLPGWGTETKYTLMRMDSVIHFNKSVSFWAGQRYGMIDITDLPPGIYGMGLLACGNGGSFTIRLK